MRLVGNYCDSGFNIFNVRDLAGRTCLHVIATKGDVKVIEDMAKIGGDRFEEILDASGGEGDVTALHLAVIHNRIDCVKVLMNHGCDINKVSKQYLLLKLHNGQYKEFECAGAFPMAALEGNVQILQTLLEVPILLLCKLYLRNKCDCSENNVACN